MSRSTPPPPDPDARPATASVPSVAALAELLDAHAPLGPAPLSSELLVFQGRGLVEVWEAAERLAGRPLSAPFWAYPWPGGAALARVLLDHPEWVRGRRVLDVGTGGGIAALAAARAGAREVVANDVDPWALATARLAAERQGLVVLPLLADLCAAPGAAAGFDVVLCGDLAYERLHAPHQRVLLERARADGARVLAADAGRAYFESEGLTRIASFTVEVAKDVEGVDRRTATVFDFG